MASEDDEHKELLSSLISDIKSYSGSDPLRPWLHGIKKMKAVLPSNALKGKLPRFLQKCAQTFESDQRYQNDARYLKIWIDLMDYVDDAKVLLKKMEKNQIGLKRASFYIAYALYYEKLRKLEGAEKMYHIGVQNLAEPLSDLQKYYEQFLHRVELYKERKSKLQEKMSKKCESKSDYTNKGEGTSKNPIPNAGPSKLVKKTKKKSGPNKTETLSRFNSENTIVVRKFVDLAIDEKSRAENVLHLGLVEPTIHTKEAMSDILSMFQKPLDLDPIIERKLRRNHEKKVKNKERGFEIYVDEENRPQNGSKNGGFEIYVDDENWPQNENKNDGFEIYVDEENRPQNENKNGGSEIFVDEENRPQSGIKNGGFQIYVDEENRTQNGSKNGGFEIYVDEENRPQNANKNGGFEIYVDEENRPQNGNKNGNRPQNENKNGGFQIYAVEENQNQNQNQKDSGFEMFMDHEGSPSQANSKSEIEQKADENHMQIPNENLQIANHGVTKQINISKVEKAKMENNRPLMDKKPVEDGLFEPTFFTKEALNDINEMFGKPFDF